LESDVRGLPRAIEPASIDVAARGSQLKPTVGALQQSPRQMGNHPSEEIDLKWHDAYLEIIRTAFRAGAVLRNKFQRES
jgi:hypothetical protein